MAREPSPPLPWPADMIRDISEAKYRAELGAEDIAKMIAKDGDQGEGLRERAGSYDRLTVAWMRVITSRLARA